MNNTNERIINALSILMRKIDYSNISISDIISLSKVSRSTFYAHYKTKDEILENICDNIFDHVFHSHLEKEIYHDFSNDNPNELKHLIVHSFYHFKEDNELIKSILDSSASQIFLRKLRKRISPLIKDCLDSNIIGNNLAPRDIKVHQYINGYIALLQYYMHHGDNITPEEISNYYFEIYK